MFSSKMSFIKKNKVKIARLINNTDITGWTKTGFPSWILAPNGVYQWYSDDNSTGSIISDYFYILPTAQTFTAQKRGNWNADAVMRFVEKSTGTVLFTENYNVNDNYAHLLNYDISGLRGKFARIELLDGKSAGYGQAGYSQVAILDGQGNIIAPFY